MIYLLNDDGSLKATVHDTDVRSVGSQLRTTTPPPPFRSGVEAVFQGGKWVERPAPTAPPLSHADLRRAAYPPVGAQLDMLWHAMDRGETPKVEPFYSAIKRVKDAYPKP